MSPNETQQLKQGQPDGWAPGLSVTCGFLRTSVQVWVGLGEQSDVESHAQGRSAGLLPRSPGTVTAWHLQGPASQCL